MKRRTFHIAGFEIPLRDSRAKLRDEAMNAKEEVEKLLPCHCTAGGHHPHCVGNYHKTVASALEARDKEIERLNVALLRIGERAVVDFDSETVGLVDAAVTNPETYAEVLKAENEQVEAMKAEIERLKKLGA